jgi:hypothetical protein
MERSSRTLHDIVSSHRPWTRAIIGASEQSWPDRSLGKSRRVDIGPSQAGSVAVPGIDRTRPSAPSPFALYIPSSYLVLHHHVVRLKVCGDSEGPVCCFSGARRPSRRRLDFSAFPDPTASRSASLDSPRIRRRYSYAESVLHPI